MKVLSVFFLCFFIVFKMLGVQPLSILYMIGLEIILLASSIIFIKTPIVLKYLQNKMEL